MHYPKLRSINGQFKDAHRAIIERKLGRALKSNEWIHHKNGNKRDYDYDNLEICSPGEHMKIHNQLGARQPKLNQLQVEIIKVLYLNSRLSCRILAKHFGIGKSTISRIVCRS